MIRTGRILLAVAAMLLMMTVPAGAAVISTVRLDICPDEESTMSAGQLAAGDEPATYDSLYFVYNYSVSGAHSEPKQCYHYIIDVQPKEGMTFSDSCSVEVRGAVKAEIQSRTPELIRVKATTYPFYILRNPSGFEIGSDEYSWSKVPYAEKYSVYIYWTDGNGDDHETKTSVTGNKHKVNVSSYQSGDRSLKGISVQAQAGQSDGAKFIAASQYVTDEGVVDDTKSEYEYKFSIPTARSNAIATSTSTTSVKNSAEKLYGPGFNISAGAPTTTLTKNGTITGNAQWMRYMNDWYYIQNGQFLTGWISPDGVCWYLMDSNGKMQTGSKRVDGKWYLLNPTEGDNYGMMLTGWWEINGKHYYFSTTHDGSYGAMLTNTVTPDGLHVGEDGAWLGY